MASFPSRGARLGRRNMPQQKVFALDALGEGGWLKAVRLEKYSPWRLPGPMALQEGLFLYLDALGRVGSDREAPRGFAQLISEGFVDCVSADAGEYGVGALVVGKGTQAKPQRPAAPSRPSGVVNR